MSAAAATASSTEAADVRAAALAQGYRARQILVGAVESDAPLAGEAAMRIAMRAAPSADLRFDARARDLGLLRRRDGRAWTYVFAEPAEALPQDAATRLLAEVNALRAATGVAPLSREKALDAAALRHAEDMRAGGFIAHQGSDGSDAGDRARDAGYWFRLVGENLAQTSDGTPEAIARLWMDSPRHRDNMLDPRFAEAGLAVVERETDDPARPILRWWAMVYGASGRG